MRALVLFGLIGLNANLVEISCVCCTLTLLNVSLNKEKIKVIPSRCLARRHGLDRQHVTALLFCLTEKSFGVSTPNSRVSNAIVSNVKPYNRFGILIACLF